jgi:uncharacterized protein YndB with AHSA1/START domain
MTVTTALHVTTPTDNSVVIVREFHAPRELVFRAWTSCELLMKWLGPEKHPMTDCTLDLRVGGTYKHVWRVDQSKLMATGVFCEIARPERLVTTERMAMDDQFFPGQSLNTLTFGEKNGKTTVTMDLQYESKEIRDQVVASGMSDGVGESYQRLDGLLKTLRA